MTTRPPALRAQARHSPAARALLPVGATARQVAAAQLRTIHIRHIPVIPSR